MLSLLRRCIEAVDRLGDSGKRSSLGYRQILLGRVPIFFRFDEEQITMRERACLGDCIVGSLAIFALLAIIGHCRGCLPIITVGDLRRSAGFVEEGPCSGAKRSEAERSGVSGVKADGLPVDQPGDYKWHV